MTIALATPLDRDNVREVHLSAFPEGEGEAVAALALKLLSEKTRPETFSLVADVEGELVGHVCFSPVTIGDDKNASGYILAPLGVKSGSQKRGVGSQLIEYGMQRLSAMGVDVLFVYGDPAYYSRFGFSVETAAGYRAPYELQYPFGWQAMVLNGANEARRPVTIACVRSLCDPALW